MSSFYKNKKVSTFLWIFIACFFHISAIFMIALYVMRYKPKILYSVFIIVTLLLLFFLPRIALQLYNLNPRILGYFLEGNWTEPQSFSFLQVSITIFSLFLIFICWDRLHNRPIQGEHDQWGKANLVTFAVFSIIFAFGKLYAQYFEVISRLNYYIAIPAFLYLSGKIKCLHGSNKIIIYPLLLIYIFYSPIRILAALQKFDDYNSFYIDVLLKNDKVNIHLLKNKRCDFLDNKFSACSF